MATEPANSQQNGPGITRIAVTGFKSLASKTDVEICPMTVLAGSNSSGKSSLMQPLLLMKQTLESSIIPAGPFLLSGPYTQYTEARQFLSRTGDTAGAPQRLTVDFAIGEDVTAGMTYVAESEAGFDIEETRGSDPSKSSPWRIDKQSSAKYLKSVEGLFSVVWRQRGLTEISTERYKFYQRIRASVSSSSERSSYEMYELRAISVLKGEIRRLIIVPGLRGDQPRKWLMADVPVQGTFEGPFESYVPSLIDSWQQRDDAKKLTDLVSGLKLLDLASGIEAGRLNESEIEIRVPRTSNPTNSDFVNIADVGLAVSTVLPVLVALIQADPGQLVYIEQPELHLHPRAQWRLAQLLAQAANRGVRLVIETHSSLLLQGILTSVATGAISSDNVAFHWFARNEEGVTKVTTANIDAEGRVGDWPADFDDVELKASNEYLDAVDAKLVASKGVE